MSSRRENGPQPAGAYRDTPDPNAAAAATTAREDADAAGWMHDETGGLYVPPEGVNRADLMARLLAHECRYCGAQPHAWCATANGARLGTLHRARYWDEVARLRAERDR